MRKKYLTKDEREIQIIQWFAERIRVDNWRSASMYEIARGLGMSPSSHLARLIIPLVDNGTILKVKRKKSGRWDGWGYKPSKKHFHKPERTVVINFIQHGIKYQMEQLL
jgi:hypothetical protein